MRNQLSIIFQTEYGMLEYIYPNQACVAVLLRGNAIEDLEVALIERALDENDRWSGHIAFPGGRTESQDQNSLATAIRETKEEIGITLQTEELVGVLEDIKAYPSKNVQAFYIRPFVFYINRTLHPKLDEGEVADLFWFPLRELTNPNRFTNYHLRLESKEMDFPAVEVNRQLPLWGLTYKMIQNLIDRLSIDLK